MFKMVMIVYNEALDEEVMEVLAQCENKNYTKISGALGKGTSSGTHQGNDTWPGRNNILYVYCDEQDAKKILLKTRELRKTLGKEGIKAFLLSAEEST
ncbi:MAG: PG0541 family transporter-associated protein [Candidatus Omnitrophota bacterium]